ncbi:MAG: hypothetical protein HC897_12195 [Thermoanaerobaculia bacterium]|nr:hypothetical protein [Thermoanaerobaculia bacterium]
MGHYHQVVDACHGGDQHVGIPDALTVAFVHDLDLSGLVEHRLGDHHHTVLARPFLEFGELGRGIRGQLPMPGFEIKDRVEHHPGSGQ